jgi:hypothetical protein
MIANQLQRKFHTIWMKNGAEIRAILTGSLPRFLYRHHNDCLENEIPVFVFHSVRPQQFAEQLRYLATNGYRSLTADELLATLRGERPIAGRTVALTFDDATGSFWAVAFPLLRKYQFKAILFVIPGLVPASKGYLPNLADVWDGRADLTEVASREQIQPLCTWDELSTMHESGLVDIQSHSMTHARVNISPWVVDFVHPRFDSHSFENINIPLSSDDLAKRPLRPLRLGQPIYRSASRLSGRPRFLENSEITQRLIQYVAQRGGADFFTTSNWRSTLARQYRQLVNEWPGQVAYESPGETEAAIRWEMALARQQLEARLDKPIRHFCYPWFQGSPFSDQIAAESGYETLFYGLGIPTNKIPVRENPARIRRISEEYLFCLPGQGRQSVVQIWASKIWHRQANSMMHKAQ